MNYLIKCVLNYQCKNIKGLQKHFKIQHSSDYDNNLNN